MKNLIRAELHKTYNTLAAKIVIALVPAITCLIGIILVSIGKLSDTDPQFIAQMNQMRLLLAGGMGTVLELAANLPISFLGIAFIFLVCQEWHHSVGLTTYTISPKRLKVIIAKLHAMLVFFIVAIIFFTLFSLLFASILSSVYEVDYSKVGHFDLLYGKAILSLFLNIMLAVAMAYCLKNQTWALILYFFLPSLTVLLVQLPFINKIGPWISLGHVPALFRIGLEPLAQEWYHILVSVVIWIVIPLSVGIARSIKEDL